MLLSTARTQQEAQQTVLATGLQLRLDGQPLAVVVGFKHVGIFFHSSNAWLSTRTSCPQSHA